MVDIGARQRQSARSGAAAAILSNVHGVLQKAIRPHRRCSSATPRRSFRRASPDRWAPKAARRRPFGPPRGFDQDARRDGRSRDRRRANRRLAAGDRSRRRPLRSTILASPPATSIRKVGSGRAGALGAQPTGQIRSSTSCSEAPPTPPLPCVPRTRLTDEPGPRQRRKSLGGSGQASRPRFRFRHPQPREGRGLVDISSRSRFLAGIGGGRQTLPWWPSSRISRPAP